MSRRRAFDVVAVAGCVIVGMAAYRLGRARADGVPMVTPLYYGGILDDSGRPVEGTRNVTVRLWDAATAGATVCTTAAGATAFSGGRFRVALDGACVGAVRANPELWAELQVDATTFPRSKLGAVPYALEAGRATGAAGALEARIAAVEGHSTGGRQVVIGSWRPSMPGGSSDILPATCSIPDGSTQARIILTGEPLSLSFTASASSLYRIAMANTSFYTASSGASTVLEISPPAPIQFFFGSAEAYVYLTAGQNYTLTAIARAPDCSRSWSVRVGSPFVVEQFN